MDTITDNLLVMLFGFAAPFTSGVVCLIIMMIFLRRCKESQARQIAYILAAELLVCVWCWFSLICFTLLPRIYTQTEFLFLASILYAQVFTYRFIFLHTRTVMNEHFSSWHYWLPLIPISGHIHLLSCF